MNASQTNGLLFAAMGFAVAAIAFTATGNWLLAATGNWLLAASFALLAASFIANWTRNRSKLEA